MVLHRYMSLKTGAGFGLGARLWDLKETWRMRMQEEEVDDEGSRKRTQLFNTLMSVNTKMA